MTLYVVLCCFVLSQTLCYDVSGESNNFELSFRQLQKQHEDQCKALQAELENERETLMHQSTKQRQTLEKDVQTLKEEETKLKDKLNQTQKVSIICCILKLLVVQLITECFNVSLVYIVFQS